LVLFLKNNAQLLAEVEAAVREKLSAGVPVSTSYPAGVREGEQEEEAAFAEEELWESS
jgi:recombination protein RecA